MNPNASTTQPKPHVITEEMRVRGNGLLAEAERAKAQAIALGSQIEVLDKLKEEHWELARDKRDEAVKILLGPMQWRI